MTALELLQPVRLCRDLWGRLLQRSEDGAAQRTWAGSPERLHRPTPFELSKWFPTTRGARLTDGDGDLTQPTSGLMKPGEGLAQVLTKDEQLGGG
jgi:hypothetical protein